ncbi:MAG: hypothetical protein HMLKMBBP_01610 [Planctomycetes bacterium]|nr:hypothetical protein [Planctomycetota bacterium]
MAVLLRSVRGGRVTEVRSAGRARRLYVDGVLHTAWNPARPLTDAVWDPLALAALALPRGAVRSALMLGLGGGAAVHLLRRHVAPRRIVAVEREAHLARIAERWFGVGGPDLRIVVADAVDFVRRRRARHDLVIDDIFGERSGEPLRAAGGAAWWRTLADRTAPGGMLVVNFAEGRHAARSGLLDDPVVRRRLPFGIRFTFRRYTNVVVALSGSACSAASLRAALAAAPGLPGRFGFTVRDVAAARGGPRRRGEPLCPPRRGA